MNGPERLFQSEGGPLAQALKQARHRVADDVKLTRIAGGLAQQGVPIDPSAIPTSAGVGSAPWPLGAKVTAGVGGVLALVAAGALLRPASHAATNSAAPGSTTTVTAVSAASAAKPAEERGLGARSVSGSAAEITATELGSEAPPRALDGAAAPENAAPAPMPEQGSAQAPLSAATAAERTVPRPEPAPTEARQGSAPSRAAENAERSFRGPSMPAGKEEEIALLKEARAALGASPAQALTLTERHRADYPRGALVQEREVIAITALARLGQTASARQRADRFRSAYPRSAYLKQIDRVLGAP